MISKERLYRLYWIDQKTIRQIASVVGVHPHTVYEWMCRCDIKRRGPTESNYLANGHKPQFVVRRQLTAKQKQLKIAGLMLYWAEGAKRGGTVDFSNSDPQMIQIFLRFLRIVCGVGESRLRVFLYHHGTPDCVEKSRRFWRKVTGISLKQFSRPYIRVGNPHRSGRVMPHGLVHVRYSDTRLLRLLLCWIQEYIANSDSISRAGTRAVKWARL